MPASIRDQARVTHEFGYWSLYIRATVEECANRQKIYSISIYGLTTAPVVAAALQDNVATLVLSKSKRIFVKAQTISVEGCGATSMAASMQLLAQYLALISQVSTSLIPVFMYQYGQVTHGLMATHLCSMQKYSCKRKFS
jgi:hypothetical protein